MTEVRWRLHLDASPDAVWELLATDDGRSRFWAESATEAEGTIEFVFPNGERHAYEARGRPIGDGYAEGGVVVFRKLSNDAVQR